MTAPLDRVRRLSVDVRALGLGAPVRAAYELAKHAGGHRALFGGLAARAERDGARAVPCFRPVYAAPADIPAAARARVLERAERIVGGEVELFGRPVDVGPRPDWYAVRHTEGRWPAEPWWWQIDIRAGAADRDVKWVWELGRHRHLVQLARAAHLDPADGRWLETLHEQLASWLAATPPERGIHWYSNLEIALRALAWLQILSLCDTALDPALRGAMITTLYHSGRHLLADLPYSLSSMRNNHLLGDALGLAAIARAFPTDARAARWRRVADRTFDAQAARTFPPGGAADEDSLSYHRFVLEMLSVRTLLDPWPGTDDRRAPHPAASIERRRQLAEAARFLERLGIHSGPVPRFGDGDEGRVLAADGDGDTLAGSTALALALAGTGARETERAAHDEVAWYAGPGIPVPSDRAERDGHDVGDTIARLERGRWTTWLKAGGTTWHGHADLCSTIVRVDDQWVVVDPGTGQYNGADEIRSWFRSSVAHSSLRLDGREILEPHRSFRWRQPAVGGVGAPLALGGGVLAWGWHANYTRLDPPRRVVRVVIGDGAPGDGTPGGVGGVGGVTVADWVEGPAGIGWALSLPLAPGTAWEDGTVVTAAGTRLTLRVPDAAACHEGEEQPLDGWYSPAYGSAVPAPRLELTGRWQGTPVCWAVSAGDETTWRADPEGLTNGDTRIRLAWEHDAVTLEVSGADGTARRVRTPTTPTRPQRRNL